MAVYGRGSEWRRWDLHDTPGAALEDKFGSWDEYVAEIESADPAIAVAGVTDYVTTRKCKTFPTYRVQGRMQNIILAVREI
jgi:hypothetical protein